MTKPDASSRFPGTTLVRAGLVSAGVAIFAGWLFLILPYTNVPYGRALTDLSYDLPFLFRKNVPIDGVVIVYMDVVSEERLSQGPFSPWDRAFTQASSP